MGTTFDEHAAVYNRWFTTPLGHLVDRVEKETLFALLPEVEGRLVLEVGCGSGNISLALAQRGAQVVGLDLSAPMLTQAQEKAQIAGLPISWVQGSAHQLPFRSGSFAGVLCILALDFMPEREKALGEMVRVLSAGGFLGVAMLNRYSLWTLKRVIRAWFRPSLWREVRFITFTGLKRLLQSQPELTDIHIRQAVHFPPFQNRSLLSLYPFLERLGRKLSLPTGAFMAVGARKKPPVLCK